MVLTDASRQLGRTPDLGGRAIGVLVVGLPLEVHAVRALVLDRLDVGGPRDACCWSHFLFRRLY